MSLFLPRWPIDRRRWQGVSIPADEAFVLAASLGSARVITAANAAAEALGIAPGLPLADARALHPALIVAAAEPGEDAAALQRLAAWCGRYSPWTAPHGSDGVWLDITGCAHLAGGEARLARDLVERLERQGISGRAAIADTPGAAWAVAWSGGEAAAVVPEGGARAALAVLPVAALRLDPAQSAELERLGLRRIGDLHALPRAALARRFGESVALRLDQALGKGAEPLSPLPPSPARWARRRFAEPIGTADALAAVTGELLAALCRQLGEEGLGARQMVLTCYRVDGKAQGVGIGTARPSRDPRHLRHLLAERLEAIDPGLGIEDVLLAARRVEPLGAAQLALPPALSPRGKQAARQIASALLAAEGRDRDGTDPAELAMLVDRLANRLGRDAVARPLPQESHVPERAVRLAPVFAVAQACWRLDPARPIRLLPRPEPIDAVAPVPDDPPLLFRWRRLAHRVRRADGPERIAGEWWRGEAAPEPRDYYRVEDEAGRRFWLYRAGLYRPEASPRWFLHGLFW